MTSLHTPPAPTAHEGHRHALALAETHPAMPPATLGGTPPASSGPMSSTRVTVLPRVENEGEAVRLVRDERARYEPIRQLGMGGMGEVVLVHDQDIARPVAIKRLLPELDDAATLVRFVDEIRTVGQLEHPNIVPIHDVGVDEQGRYFFVMKYVEGETLEAIIEKLRAGDAAYHKRYTIERRMEIFLGVLHALEFAHSHGIVHRDIKPANVMVGRYGEVVLMDWGIAKPMAAARDSRRGPRPTPPPRRARRRSGCSRRAWARSSARRRTCRRSRRAGRTRRSTRAAISTARRCSSTSSSRCGTTSASGARSRRCSRPSSARSSASGRS